MSANAPTRSVGYGLETEFYTVSIQGNGPGAHWIAGQIVTSVPASSPG